MSIRSFLFSLLFAAEASAQQLPWYMQETGMTADGRVDTVLPLQNYFSVLFPDVATATRGTLHVFAVMMPKLGTWLGE